ncbi:MAG: hypothetical protein VXW98_07170, partial [Actinomycetota bacterium]|nr:hypothetical protein [Actinomycetota bacterium]
MDVAFNFNVRHRPKDGEKQREVRLNLLNTFAFPFQYQELAFVLPNSTFESAGAQWGQVKTEPSFRMDRTTTTTVGGIRIPPHELTMNPLASCTLSFRNVELDAGPLPSGLHEDAAYAFASEFLKRFQWLADEHGKGNEFVLQTNRLSGEEGTPMPTAIVTAGDLIPKRIQLSNIDYAGLRNNQLKQAWENSPTTDFETDFDPVRDTERVAELEAEFKGKIFPAWNEGPSVAAWSDEAIFKIVKKRLKGWNRQLSAFKPTGVPSLARSGSDGEVYRFVEDGVAVTIEVQRREERTAPAQSLKSIADFESFVTPLTMLPLFQRFRLLALNATALELIELALDPDPKYKFDLLFKDAMEYRVLPMLIEFTAVLFKLKQLPDDPFEENEKLSKQIDALKDKLSAKLGRSGTKFNDYFKELLARDAT